MLVTYIILMSVTILLSTFGYVYAYFAIRNGLDNNFQALLREQQLSYDKEWLRAQASARYIGSNTKARELMTLKHWQAADRIGPPFSMDTSGLRLLACICMPVIHW